MTKGYCLRHHLLLVAGSVHVLLFQTIGLVRRHRQDVHECRAVIW